jgi:hypothetical protein
MVFTQAAVDRLLWCGQSVALSASNAADAAALGVERAAAAATTQVGTARQQVANRGVRDFRVGDRSRGRYATPADFPRHDGTAYRGLRVSRWGLGLVHRSRAVFCHAVIRHFCIRCRWPRGRCCASCTCATGASSYSTVAQISNGDLRFWHADKQFPTKCTASGGLRLCKTPGPSRIHGNKQFEQVCLGVCFFLARAVLCRVAHFLNRAAGAPRSSCCRACTRWCCWCRRRRSGCGWRRRRWGAGG